VDESPKSIAVMKLLDVMMHLQLRPVDVFRAIDLNHDSKITKRELKVGLQRIGCEDLEDADIASMIAECDEDGDGKLDVKEWKDALEQKYHERHHEQSTQPDLMRGVSFVHIVFIKLAMVFPKDAQAEEQFKRDLVNDVATALDADPLCFEIKSMVVGSIIVQLALKGRNSKGLKTQLEAQITDKSSLLYKGKVTKHVMSEAKRKKKRKGKAEQEQQAEGMEEISSGAVDRESTAGEAAGPVGRRGGVLSHQSVDESVIALHLQPEKVAEEMEEEKVEAKAEKAEGRSGRRGGVLAHQSVGAAVGQAVNPLHAQTNTDSTRTSTANAKTVAAASAPPSALEIQKGKGFNVASPMQESSGDALRQMAAMTKAEEAAVEGGQAAMKEWFAKDFENRIITWVISNPNEAVSNGGSTDAAYAMFIGKEFPENANDDRVSGPDWRGVFDRLLQAHENAKAGKGRMLHLHDIDAEPPLSPSGAPLSMFPSSVGTDKNTPAPVFFEETPEPPAPKPPGCCACAVM
jgi:hypothetical protein